MLLVQRGTRVSAGDLVDALWEEDMPASAATTARTYVSRLRRVLGPDAGGGQVIRSVGGGYQLDVADDELDLAVFRRHVAAAERAGHAGDVRGQARELAAGLGLWRGVALAGLPGPFAGRHRAILEQQRITVRTARLRAGLDAGEAVLAELSAMAVEYPLDEQVQELLITGLYRAGRQADALAAYQETRSRLAGELGIDPGPALRLLQERILRADLALMAPAGEPSPQAAAEPSPEAVEDSPRLPGGRRRLGNLPAQVSSFIGRDGELAAVRELLASWRLVTLAGVGGSGKTRLAVQAAAGLTGAAAARDGTWFADLAPLGDPGLVPVTVADVLGVQLKPDHPPLEVLAAAVGDRGLLLLLDNCEHVIDACAKLANTLLRSCPRVTILATSREPLGIEGERVYRVGSMGVPADGDDAGAIRAAEAVRLLEDRAAGYGVSLAWDEDSTRLAGRICRRLDGIPLAIELAAARLQSMPTAELDARLDQRFVLLTGGSRAGLPRQQTLRAMMDWSWELLTGPERAVLARLSAFAGSFAMAAAEAVAPGPDLPVKHVPELLGGLVGKSLVQFGDSATQPGRYRLLETVREYAAGQLAAPGPEGTAAVRMAHRDYYLALAEEAAPHLVAAEAVAWLNRLDAELGNLRAAVAFSLAQADPEPGLRLAVAIRWYWQIRGRSAEGIDVLQALLASPRAQAPTELHVLALDALGRLLDRIGNEVAAGRLVEEALAIVRATGTDYLGDLIQFRAWILLRLGQQDAARPLLDSALELARQRGDLHLMAHVIATRGYAAYIAGDNAASARDAAEAKRLFQQSGDLIRTGTYVGNLGMLELIDGDLDAARTHLAEALDIARAANIRSNMVFETHHLGLAQYLSGALDAAEALFAESLDLARQSGMNVEVGYALLGLALASRGGAQPGWAAQLHGAADQALADPGHSWEPLERRLADQDRERLRGILGDEAFAAEYAAGRTLDPARVLEILESPADGEPGGVPPPWTA